MIRLFNHHIRWSSLSQVLMDGVLLIGVIFGSIALQAESLSAMSPMASTQVLSFAAGLVVIGSASGIYRRNAELSLGQICVRCAVVLLLALGLVYGFFATFASGLEGSVAAQWAAMAGVAGIVLRRGYLMHTGFRSGKRTRVLVFGAGAAAEVVGTTLERVDPLADIVGYVPGPNEQTIAVSPAQLLRPKGSLLEAARALGVDEIVVALTERRQGSMPLRELLDCKLRGLKVYDLATHFEKRLGQIRVDFVNAGWLVFGDGFNRGTWRSVVKRVFDLAVSVLLIVATLPLMLAAALLIKLDSRGPVLYRQERVGQNGSVFMVLKFRSMRIDAEQDGQPRWAEAKDHRVTRVGGVIRKLRIDELPQLLNVLRGEMSLVGPRPERPFFVDQLTQQIPFYAVRHSVKPGVTGWAQVKYQYGSTVEDSQEKLQYDLYYVKNHSLFLDVLVLFETIGVVLTGKGAR